MGLLDNLYFGHRSNFGGQNGGLLDFLRSTQMQQDQYQPSGGFSPMAPPPQPETGGQAIQVGGLQMPRIGGADQFDPAQVNLPPNSQPTSGQMPQPMQQPDIGFGDRIGTGLMNFANAGGLLPALAGGLDGLMTGHRSDRVGNANQTAQLLVSKGIDPALAKSIVSDPATLRSVLPSLIGGSKGEVINNRLVDPRNGRVIADFSDTKAPETKEFETVGGGKVPMQWDPSSKSWKKIEGVQGGGVGKPPAGYQWVDINDPSKGFTAIPGGPGTHLPAETAGRIAMMETSAAELPKARETLMKNRGDTGTTLANAASSATNMGEYSRANRTVRLAIEGALRAMTGAAAPDSEVKRYEDLFMPGAFDSRETATQKLNQLDDFIANASRLVKQGRGPAGNVPQSRASDPLGIR